jgi:hypothetical protein
MSDRPAIPPAIVAAVDATIVPALQPAVAAAIPAAVQCPHAHLRSHAGSTGSLGQAEHVDSHLQTHHGKPHHPQTLVQADHPFSHVQAGDHPVSHVLALGRTIGRTIGSTIGRTIGSTGAITITLYKPSPCQAFQLVYWLRFTISTQVSRIDWLG